MALWSCQIITISLPFWIKEVFADPNEQKGEETAHENPEKGREKFAEAEDLEVKQPEMMDQYKDCSIISKPFYTLVQKTW